MRNKFLKFNNIEFNGKYVKNITEYNILPDIPYRFHDGEGIIKHKLIEDDSFIEGISFIELKDVDSWDIIMFLNDMRNMDDLPVSYDRLSERIDKEIEKWKEKAILIYFDLDNYIVKEHSFEFISLKEKLNINPDYTIEEVFGKPAYEVKLEDIKRMELEHEMRETNEKFRKIKIIPPTEISTLIGQLDELNSKPKINFDVIVNNSDVDTETQTLYFKDI